MMVSTFVAPPAERELGGAVDPGATDEWEAGE
jgi:hypothetical protein